MSLALTTALVGTGCSNHSGASEVDSSREASSSAPREIDSNRAAPSGIDDLPTTAVWNRIEQVSALTSSLVGVQIQTCMSRSGFDFVVNTAKDVLTKSPDELTLRYAGPRRDGDVYGYSFSSDAIAPSESIEPSQPEDGPAFRRALLGDGNETIAYRDPKGNVLGDVTVPRSGCQREAFEAVYGSVSRYAELSGLVAIVNKVTVEGNSSMLASDEAQRLISAWSQCLSEKGVQGVHHLGDLRSREWPTPQPSEQEQHVALIDRECRDGVDLDLGLLRIEVAVQARSLESYADLPQRVARLQDEILSRASA